jgi:hypothetical protein
MTDVSNDAYLVRAAVVEAMAFIAAPHVRMRPSVYPDGDKWCCLYGDDLQVGIAGFGDTAEQACAAFDRAWSTERTPAAALRARSEADHD